MNEKAKDTVWIALLFLSLAGAGFGVWLFLCRISSVSMVSYKVMTNGSCPSFAWFLLAGLPALLFFRADLRGIRKKAALAALPFLLFFLLPDDNFLSFPVSLLTLGWGAFRLIRTFGCRTLRQYPILTEDRGGTVFFALAMAVAAGMIFWSFHMQLQAYRSLYFCYADWGLYFESYLRMASGDASWKEWLSSGSHWNPLPNAVMGLFVKLFPKPEAFFLFNSLIIYSAVPLTWILCRRSGLLPFRSFCFTMAAAFSPVYGNLSLCLYYGYHPVYFAIPFLLLFFIFREKGSRTGMILCMAATMMIKETVMIFWIGYGLWLLLSQPGWKNRIAGALLIAVSLTGFILLSSKVLPALVDTTVYPLTFLYSELGDTPLAVLHSPFTRPETFWKICFQWQNFAYLSALLTPCFFCLWLRPDMLIILIPLLAGVCLRPSPDVKNIMLQYSTEAATVLLTASILGFSRLRRGKNTFWTDLLLTGSRGKIVSKRLLLTDLAVVSLLVSLMAYYCFAQNAFGKNSFREISVLMDQSDAVRSVRRDLTPGARVLASERIRAHLIDGHVTASLVDNARPGDFIVMLSHEKTMDDPQMLERLRQIFAADPHVIPVDSVRTQGGGCIMIFRRIDGPGGPAGVPRPPVVSADAFKSAGTPIRSDLPEFEVRHLFRDRRHIFSIRLTKVPDFDADVLITLKGAWGTVEEQQPFAMGLFPAYSCQEGSVFTVTLEAPRESEASCRFEKRVVLRKTERTEQQQ